MDSTHVGAGALGLGGGLTIASAAVSRGGLETRRQADSAWESFLETPEHKANQAIDWPNLTDAQRPAAREASDAALRHPLRHLSDDLGSIATKSSIRSLGLGAAAALAAGVGAVLLFAGGGPSARTKQHDAPSDPVIVDPMVTWRNSPAQ